VADHGETQYAAVGESDIAYQVIGEGSVDLLYFYGLGNHLELMRLTPGWNDFLARLTDFCRVIIFDRRGAGASDGFSQSSVPSVEDWTEDIGAVLDATGVQDAAIIASADAGPIAMLFAALHPERVRSLVLLNTSARYRVDDDYPIGATGDEVDALIGFIRDTWGSPEFSAALNSDAAEGDHGFLEESARWSRFAATPRSAAAQFGYILGDLDVRRALPLISAPTMVLHVEDSGIIPASHGHYIADRIPGARFVSLPGGSLSMTPNLGLVLDELSEFLTGERRPPEVERVLTTIVFTDIVGSTDVAAELGDRRWKELLDSHDRLVREQLERSGGQEVKTTGDGFLISFDGPARAIRFCQAAVAAVRPLGLEIRAGIHTGECDRRGDDLGGMAVHIASRVGALAEPSEVLVTGTVRDLVVGSELSFEARGARELKGVPGSWDLLAVDGQAL
jgi:class 3 adenylate cyclase/pimeloyl-ACP methyl ester carboxylesterase